MKAILVALFVLQLGPRPPLAPAETLLAPESLRALHDEIIVNADSQLFLPENPPPMVVDGTDATAGEVILTCDLTPCGPALRSIQKLRWLVARKQLPPPTRTIRYVPSGPLPPSSKAVIQFLERVNRFGIAESPWSMPAIGDEVSEIFANYVTGQVTPRYAFMGAFNTSDLGVERYDAPVTTVLAGGDDHDRSIAGFVGAATSYFLATLPNRGAEALLSHLTVGAHARLAEDGRNAVAQMGSQQRAGAEVLIMFGQAIEREQRRMRSFETFMPAPVDPMLHSRILDMEKGITSVWTSMGISSSPFVPAAERIRGRGGEDRRVPARINSEPIKPVEMPTAFLKFDRPELIVYELHNFIDGKRSISDIRDAVSAEFGALPLPSVVDYFERLAKSGAITLK